MVACLGGAGAGGAAADQRAAQLPEGASLLTWSSCLHTGLASRRLLAVTVAHGARARPPARTPQSRPRSSRGVGWRRVRKQSAGCKGQ